MRKDGFLTVKLQKAKKKTGNGVNAGGGESGYRGKNRQVIFRKRQSCRKPIQEALGMRIRVKDAKKDY